MNSFLGIFDSGVGGFTVLKRVLERHGNLPCLYLADCERLPYGEKSPSEIREIASEVVQWLCEQDVSAVLVACNTTNSLALDVVERLAKVKVVSLINSAALMVNESRVGVLATPATTASSIYRLKIEAIRPGTFVLEQACPAFVPLIEAGHLNSLEIRKAANEYLRPLLKAGVESIVLGCSHYPLIEPLLRELLPIGIRLLDPAIGLAIEMDGILGSPRPSSQQAFSCSNTRFCVTSNPENFALKAKAFLGVCPEVQMVSLRSKACFS